jgi:acetyl esterase/lipase
MYASKDTYTYKSVCECEIRADIYRGPGDGPHPVIVWIHGGALIMGHRGSIPEWQRNLYLQAGYTVVSIDYRLAPETKLPQIIEDLRDAWHWVREDGPSLFQADARRIAVIGHSAGGYLALMSGCSVQPRPRALISFYGYGDLVGPWYSEPDPYYCQQPMVPEEEARSAVGRRPLSEASEQPGRERFYLYCRQQGRWPNEVAGRDPNSEPHFFREFCPLQNITADYPPTLLLHGDRDTDVPYEQSTAMAQALARAGVEHDLITIPGGDHGFDGTRSPAGAGALARVLAFLNAHLQ